MAVESQKRSVIRGIGSYLPPNVVDNLDSVKKWIPAMNGLGQELE